MRWPPNVRVLGVGNLDRGDDDAGRIAADLLRGQLPQEIEIIEDTGEAASLLARVEDARAAVIIDACRSGAATGRIRRFDVSNAPLPEGRFAAASTHALGLAAAIEWRVPSSNFPRVASYTQSKELSSMPVSGCCSPWQRRFALLRRASSRSSKNLPHSPLLKLSRIRYPKPASA